MNGFSFFYFRNKENKKELILVGFPTYEIPENVALEKLIENSSAILPNGSPIKSTDLLKDYEHASVYLDTSYDRII